MRVYTDDDVDWLRLRTILRGADMPLPDLRRYTELVRAGEGNEPGRLNLLRQHEQQAVSTGMLYLAAMLTGARLYGWLLRHAGGHAYPHDAPGLWGLVPAVTGSINAGVVEELLLVGFLVTALR